MNILVTGGLGYLGSEILDRAASLNPQGGLVSFGRNPVSQGVALPAPAIHEVGSIMDEAGLAELLARHQISHMVHAAGARTDVSKSHPHRAVETNVLGTHTLMRAAKSAPSLKAVVLLSTAAVYGKVGERIDEGHPIAPSNHYAVTKAAAELVVTGSAAEAGIRAVIVRPGFVMGPSRAGIAPRSRLNGVVHRSLSEESVDLVFAEMFYVHLVQEIADSILRLTAAEDAEGIFHLPGRCATMTEFADGLAKVAKVRVASSVDETMRLPANLDCGRFEERFGPSQGADLETMIRRTYRGFSA